MRTTTSSKGRSSTNFGGPVQRPLSVPVEAKSVSRSLESTVRLGPVISPLAVPARHR